MLYEVCPARIYYVCLCLIIRTKVVKPPFDTSTHAVLILVWWMAGAKWNIIFVSCQWSTSIQKNCCVHFLYRAASATIVNKGVYQQQPPRLWSKCTNGSLSRSQSILALARQFRQGIRVISSGSVQVMHVHRQCQQQATEWACQHHDCSLDMSWPFAYSFLLTVLTLGLHCTFITSFHPFTFFQHLLCIYVLLLVFAFKTV